MAELYDVITLLFVCLFVCCVFFLFLMTYWKAHWSTEVEINCAI